MQHGLVHPVGMRFESATPDMHSATTPLALALFVGAIAGAWPARAQDASPACVAATGPDVSPVTPDSGAASRASATSSAARTQRGTTNPTVRLLASVQAQEVRFARQPTICVRLRGDARLDSVHVVARRNIRSPVVVGATYRDVYVAVEILGHLDAQCVAARITGQPASGLCTSLGVRDSASARVAPSREGGP